ncbi:MAG: DUF1552 domain-containing protein [Fuerstiella sp.]|nr:DUF1552 domain-containing protein [Fuerstiella sp.]MCP4513380.1 DUF1552 domain-containing protein [Fuerstiella sp.]
MDPLHRRTLLRASGVSLALPFLEAMNPVFAATGNVPPKRMVFVCTALGLHPPLLWPATSGADYESTPYLDLLQDHRRDFTLFSGLQHEDQTGRQPHDSEITWLTSARKPGMGGFRNTISVDQVAAGSLGNVTRYPSITLGTIKPQSQSFTRGGVMIPAQTSPASLFAQLFLEGTPDEVRVQKRRLSDGRSILDQLSSQTKTVRRKASSADNHLLDDYFDSVRKAETNIAAAEGWMEKPKPDVDAQQPKDIRDNADLIGRAQLLMDLVPLIVQTDCSRVVSVMIQDHYVVPKVEGVTGNHHNLSHHGQDTAKIGQLQKIEKEIVECFGSLLSQMKNKSESGGTLLDNTTILFGSNLGNANAHHARNLPIFLAGGGFQHGQYVVSKQDKPLCNLFVTMLNNMDIETESFGQSTGSLSW